jgi:hypothetical protein
MPADSVFFSVPAGKRKAPMVAVPRLRHATYIVAAYVAGAAR